MPERLCLSTVHDGHERVGCALEPHPEGTDHRRGFLAWDDAGRWYACREFPDLYPTIGTLLHEARERRGLTQHQVAHTLNLTRSSVANIEAGRQRMPLHTWVVLCQTLGVDPADVISRAIQATGPGGEPLPAGPDKRTADLRRHLEAANGTITRLLADIPGADHA
jgi:DNA-binding XRE family transcriptional regulator